MCCVCCLCNASLSLALFRALCYVPAVEASSVSNVSSTSSSSSSSNGDVAAASENSEAEQQPLASPEAAVAAALAAGLPQQLVDALSAEQLQQQPQLVASWATWLRVWRGRLAEEGMPDSERMAMQAAASPKFVPRQHLLQVGRPSPPPPLRWCLAALLVLPGLCNVS